MAELPDRGHDEALRKALLRADPLLSRYDPLERLLMHCDFDAGIHGWQTYFPDYDGDSDYPGRDPHFQPLDEWSPSRAPTRACGSIAAPPPACAGCRC